MKEVYWLRKKSDGKQTLGAVVAQNLDEIFVAKTLELAWKNNASEISCIPVGEYICKWTRSNRLSRESLTRWLKANSGKTEADCPDEFKNVFTYEVMDVPLRAGIRIHSANYFFQLLGCLAMGDSHKDINMDVSLDTVHSGDTVKKFNAIMNKEDFKLIIKLINT